METRDDFDLVWKALADPTRRGILDLLRAGPRTTSQIVCHFPHLSRFGVMKHLEILRQADLIGTREEGRLRIHTLNVVPIQMIYDRWVRGFEPMWASSLLKLKSRLEGPPDSGAGT